VLADEMAQRAPVVDDDSEFRPSRLRREHATCRRWRGDGRSAHLRRRARGGPRPPPCRRARRSTATPVRRISRTYVSSAGRNTSSGSPVIVSRTAVRSSVSACAMRSIPVRSGERPVEDAAGALPAPVGSLHPGTVGSVASTRAGPPGAPSPGGLLVEREHGVASARERHAARTISFAVAFARSTRPRCVSNAPG
jgi:hypothetical protein